MTDTVSHIALRILFARLALLLVLPLVSGCPQYADWRVPEDILQRTEPSSERDYYVYVPSTYTPEQTWPLVILCHGTTPWDNAQRQIRDWVKLAEEKGFIVAAPKLRGTRGDFPPDVKTQLERQREDEAAILGVVRHLQGGYAIARDRIFLTGWSAGGFAVLHTGLSHPEIFRALVVLQGNFRSEFLAEAKEHIDPYQPVFVLYGSTDVLTGGEGRDCVDWLYQQNAYVLDGMIPGPHRSHPNVAYDFFEKVIYELPWMRLRSYVPDPSDPNTVRFKAMTSFEPEAYHWWFGLLGDSPMILDEIPESPIASPTHTFTRTGTYSVNCTITDTKGREHKRSLNFRIPHPTAPTGLEH